MHLCHAPQCRGLALFAAAFVLATISPAQAPTNVVLIVADDLGYGDVGPYDHDADPLTPDVTNTPVLDQLGLDGARFTSFYTTAPVCTPTRAALLTGRYQVRSGVTGILFPNDPNGLPASEITLAEICRERGYRTHVVGKWHLGDQPQFNPLQHGFDGFFGVPYSNDMEPLFVLHDTTVEDPAPDQRYLTQRFFTEARAFVQASAAASAPFFLYLPLTMPHVPVYVSPAFDGATGRGLYADCVREVDACVGDLLADLSSLGVAEDTLVVFTSDNGPWDNTHFPPPGHPELWRWVGGSSGGLRGSKATYYEGGLRVPCIVRWPARVAPESVVGTPVTCMDLFDTVVRAAGGSAPTDRPIDGRDMVQLIGGAHEFPPRDLFFCAVFNSSSGQYGQCRVRAMRSGPWKVLFDLGLEPYEIYDLETDPGETTPLDLPALRGVLQDRARTFQCTLDEGPAGEGILANFALGRPTHASSSVNCDSSRAAVDGLASTTWTSAFGEAQWMAVDLERAVHLNRVVLRWSADFAVSYALETSLDGATWTPLAIVSSGDGNADVHHVAVLARHLRVMCGQSSAGLGYALAELRAFGFDARSGGSSAGHVAGP